MSCPHAETTTLLWLHGELEPEREEAHLAHVADCAECTAVLEAEEQVLAAVAPIAGALEAVRPADPLPAPVNRPVWLVWVAVATAAAALLVIGLRVGTPADPGDTDLAIVSPVSPGVADPPQYALDAGLEDLDLELAELSLDMETL